MDFGSTLLLMTSPISNPVSGFETIGNNSGPCSKSKNLLNPDLMDSTDDGCGAAYRREDKDAASRWRTDHHHQQQQQQQARSTNYATVYQSESKCTTASVHHETSSSVHESERKLLNKDSNVRLDNNVNALSLERIQSEPAAGVRPDRSGSFNTIPINHGSIRNRRRSETAVGAQINKNDNGHWTSCSEYGIYVGPGNRVREPHRTSTRQSIKESPLEQEGNHRRTNDYSQSILDPINACNLSVSYDARRNSRTVRDSPMLISGPMAASNTSLETDPRARACCFCWCCCCSCSCLRIQTTLSDSKHRPSISDDHQTHLNSKVLDEKVTYEDVRSWGESFDSLMQSATGRSVFQEFLRSEFSEENIMFWLACEELKLETNPEIIEEKARIIYEDFISILSPKEVSLDSRVREIINANMIEPTPRTFDEAQLQIYTLMHRDSYLRFLNSRLYKELLQRHAPSSVSNIMLQ